jgi:hypothetical protein
VLAVALFAVSFWLFQTSLPGFLCAGLIMVMGFLMGFVSPSIMGVTALLSAMFAGYILVFRHA